MTLSSKFLPRLTRGRGLFALASLCLLAGSPASAQNIDEGKSAQQLYAATCATCHKNPGVLAKGRFRATLFPFLKDHYTTGTAEAWALAAYIASVDAGPATAKRATKKKRPASAPSDQPN